MGMSICCNCLPSAPTYFFSIKVPISNDVQGHSHKTKQSKARQNKTKFLRTGIKILGSKMWQCPSSLSTYSEANQLFYLQKFVWDFCVYGLYAMCFADVVLGIPHALYLHCVGEDGTKTKCARVACYHLYFHYCYWKNQGGKFFHLHSHFSYNQGIPLWRMLSPALFYGELYR